MAEKTDQPALMGATTTIQREILGHVIVGIDLRNRKAVTRSAGAFRDDLRIARDLQRIAPRLQLHRGRKADHVEPVLMPGM